MIKQTCLCTYTHFSVGLLPHFNHQKTRSGNEPGLCNKENCFWLEPRFFFFFFAIAKRCWDLWGKKEWLSDESRWLLPWELAFLFCFFIAANCKKQSPRNPSCDIIMIAYSSSKSLNPLPRKGQTEVIHRNVSVPLLLHPLWGKGSTFLACGFHRCSLTAEEWAYVYV